MSTNSITLSLSLSQSAVGLFHSKVKVHVVLFANRGSDDYSQLKERVGALAPRYTQKVVTNLLYTHAFIINTHDNLMGLVVLNEVKLDVITWVSF